MADNPKIGPNVKKLIAHTMALDAVPTGGGITSVVRFLSNPEKIKTSAKKAVLWVDMAIKVVRQAKEPNPWKTSDDEAIAGEILRLIEVRKREQKDGGANK